MSHTISPWTITPRIIAPQTNAKATTEIWSTKQLSTLVTIYPIYYLTWSSSFSKIQAGGETNKRNLPKPKRKLPKRNLSQTFLKALTSA